MPETMKDKETRDDGVQRKEEQKEESRKIDTLYVTRIRCMRNLKK